MILQEINRALAASKASHRQAQRLARVDRPEFRRECLKLRTIAVVQFDRALTGR